MKKNNFFKETVHHVTDPGSLAGHAIGHAIAGTAGGMAGGLLFSSSSLNENERIPALQQAQKQAQEQAQQLQRILQNQPPTYARIQANAMLGPKP